jgi:GNAT superfamily N-acetyltransferase
MPEEQDVHADHDGYQREHVKHDGYLSSHRFVLLAARQWSNNGRYQPACQHFVILIAQPGYLLLDNIAVRPDAQGRGIGARLLDLAEDHARCLHLGEIRLYTNQAMTENLSYYPRHGYTETHRAEQDGFHRVYFRKPLD